MVSNAKEHLFWSTNPDWYDYDENEQPYLTDKAPEEAKKSFEQYLMLIKRQKSLTSRII